jgi:hypothetical protein
MNLLLILISLLFVVIGVAIVAKADRVGAAIASFYKNYPVVRHAGQEQFVVKRSYAIVLGLVVIAIGVAGLISVVL